MSEPSSAVGVSLVDHLQQLTETLATTHTQQDVLDAALQPAMSALGALAGAILLLDPVTQFLSVAAVQGSQAKTIWQDGPLSHETPAGDVLLKKEPLYFEHAGALKAAYPHLEEQTGGIAAVATTVQPFLLEGQPLGVLILDFKDPHLFTAEEKLFLPSLVAQCSVALDRAQLITDLDTQVRQRTSELEMEREALQAFAAFTEAVSTVSDVLTLAQQAVEVLQATLPGLSVAYYEQMQGLWYCRAWSEDVPAEVVAQMQAGVPDFAQAVRTGTAVFAEVWDAAGNDLLEATMYRAAGFLPLVVEGYVRALVSVGKQTSSNWTARERSIVRAVVQGLTLALERGEATRQLQAQKEEAEKRSQALEAFAELSRDLAGETNRFTLVHRAQEIMMSLLTPGYALYWEEASDRWELKSQVGDIGDPALQQLVEKQGLPLNAPALHSTWLTGLPNYQDNYAQGADTPAEMIRHVKAATAFRIQMYGRPIGMLAIGLFDQRFWTPMDKSVLETAIHSLGLVLERAQSVAALAQSNQELQAANEELEAFTYSASHDLRTPVRHVMGFAELAERAMAKGQYEKVESSLKVVKQGALRMTSLIDGMLLLSRSSRQQLQREAVDLNALATQARRDAAAEFSSHPVHWQISDLPTVQGDENLLQQVMTNLLSNAVKYSAKREQSEVSVWCEDNVSEWTIRVRDNGVGFDPEHAQKLFGIFQRLHTEKDFKGTGVGLATMRRIVQKHGGEVFAESDGHTGATFGFSLPK